MSVSSTHEIGIVHYPGAQVACILGLTDFFGIASTIALDQGRSGQTALRVTHWKPIDSFDANLSCVYGSAPSGSPQPRTLVIPPTMVGLPDPDVPLGVVSWVRNRHAAGATLISLCSGAFILAQTGLVDGKCVGTHQICAKSLAKRFPQIVVDVNRRIVDYGDMVTAGGFLSWVDIGLFLVDRILGPTMSAETARFVLSDPAGEARNFTGFAPPQTHGDRAVLKGSGVGAHERRTGRFPCCPGDGGRTRTAHAATAVRERNRHDPDRVLSSCSHCASARALGGWGHLAEADRRIPRL
jgi:transcriptional regulator GlxA family with amidase domain